MGEEKDLDNMWAQMLESCAKNSNNLQGTVICVGDKHCGKSSLIRELYRTSFASGSRNQSGANGADSQKDALLSYLYYDHEATRSGGLSAQRVHVWTVRDSIFDNFHVHLENLNHVGYGLSAINQQITVPRLAYVVAVDMSTGAGEVLASLQQWLVRVHRHAQQYHAHIGAEKSNHAKDAHEAYLRQARTNQGQSPRTHTEEKGGSSALPHSPAAQSIGVPIIVCMCKCDTIYNDGKDAPTELGKTRDARYFASLQGQLRALCLEAGAALVYTAAKCAEGGVTSSSSSSSSSSTNDNIDTLSQYITHRLFPEHVPMRPPLAVVGSIDSAFVPAGLDSPDAIRADTGYEAQGGQGLLATFESSPDAESQPQEPVAAEAHAGGAMGVAKVEDERLWLSDLHAYITQATTGVVVPRVSAAELAIADEISSAQARSSSSKNTSNQACSAGAPAASRRKGSAPSSAAAQDVTDFFTRLLDAR